MTRLLVNLDPVAAFRQSHPSNQPDPVAVALQAVLGGADGIAVSIGNRSAQIRGRDIRILSQTVQGRLVLRMPPASEAIGSALEFKPDMVTLTSADDAGQGAGGLDIMALKAELAETMEPLKNSGINVCLRIDPDPSQVKLAHKLDADAVEIDTRAFSLATSARVRGQILIKITDTAKLAGRLPMHVMAAQGLDYQCIQNLATIKEIKTFCVGHSIAARAVLVGMTQAVRDMRQKISD